MASVESFGVVKMLVITPSTSAKRACAIGLSSDFRSKFLFVDIQCSDPQNPLKNKPTGSVAVRTIHLCEHEQKHHTFTDSDIDDDHDR